MSHLYTWPSDNKVQWDLLFIKYIQDMCIRGINILPIRLKDNIISQQSYSSTNTLRVCITSPVKRYTDASEKWNGTWQMCTGTKTLCDCVCPSHNTLFPGLTQENMGELKSRCRSVLVCLGWHDFVSEYWTGLLCDLRQRRIVRWHPGLSQQGTRVYITPFLCIIYKKVSIF